MQNIVFDMDNTLSYATDRLYKHPLHLKPSARVGRPIIELWKDYYKGCSDDKPVQGVVNLAHLLNDKNIFIVTARDEQARDETELWLTKHNINYKEIFMRPINIKIKATEVKKQAIKQIISRFGSIDLILEDDIRNIKVFLEMGWPVIKVDTLCLL